MNRRCVCLEPGSRALGGSSLGFSLDLLVKKLELLPLQNQAPVLSGGSGGPVGNRMGQQGEWNCFSSQPFPLRQEKMNPLVEMGGRGGRGERKLPPEKEPSPTLGSIVLPQSSLLFPLSPFPLLSSLSSDSLEES